jgi:predicted alpha-1,2-mannosidase
MIFFMRKVSKLLWMSLILMSACRPSTETDLASYVDPFIGTGGHGHTYPGVSLPFGMMQLSPDSRLEGWDGCSGYHYSDTVIYGFSHTHLSGTGVSDYGDLLLMPLSRGKKLDKDSVESGYPSYFSKGSERATPGYYSVILKDEMVLAELSGTERTGIHRYTFLDDAAQSLLLDLIHRDKVTDSYICILSDTEIVGCRISEAWAKEQHFYFSMRFSRPLKTIEVSGYDTLSPDSTFFRGSRIQAFIDFETDAAPMLVKVAMSGVDTSGARLNLEAENPGWDFDATRIRARQAWNEQLGKIRVEGGTKAQRRTFYTALYHACLNPNIWSDVDGRYRGRDLKVHQEEGDQYTLFSLWDTYRATHPLFTIIEPARSIDFLETFLRQYREGGRLPVWELSANETDCMIGYHSVSVIADAYAKGLFNKDKEALYQAMKASAMAGDRGLRYYKSLGFIPFDKEGESVSKTLEYAYDDWCIAQVAKMLNNQEDYEYFMARSQAYRNFYDPVTGFLRARSAGFWFQPFDPAEVNFNYTEANAWQYIFYVPHDLTGFMEIMGGPEAFTGKLDELFTAPQATTGREQADITGLIGQYAHGNEPSHHMAYLYSYAAKPSMTQKMVRRIMAEMYHDGPDGLCGNEDCGQMSAWYVMSAMGFYQVAPGQPEYVIGSPLFEKVVIDLGNGKTFTIRSNRASDKSVYVQGLKLNGKELERSYFSHQEMMSGGELRFCMRSKPSDFGSEQVPVTTYPGQRPIPVPVVSEGKKVFRGSTKIALQCAEPEARIFYTMDTLADPVSWKEYRQPFRVDQSTYLWAYALNKGLRSRWMKARLERLPEQRGISLATAYASQYSGGGDDALIDLIRGGDSFKTGAWQGYQLNNLDAVIDLGRVMPINEVSTGFIQDMPSWIFMPLRMEVFTSDDGSNWEQKAVVQNTVSEFLQEPVIQEFTARFTARARYLRVVAVNRGHCPDWHLGAGGESWVFADEITVK